MRLWTRLYGTQRETNHMVLGRETLETTRPLGARGAVGAAAPPAAPPKSFFFSMKPVAIFGW